MSAIFADTSYFLALVNPKDQWHHAADALAGRSASALVTTRAVLLEFGNTLTAQPVRHLALRLLDSLDHAPTVEVVPLSDDLWTRGVGLFRERPDKEWSLTDCISFIVMEDRGLTDALTGDRHFEQAGFNALLRAEGQV